MRRPILTFLITLLGISMAIAQGEKPGFQFGGKMGYDYQVGLPVSNRFVPFGQGQVGMMNFEFFTGIPLGPVCLYPSSSWGVGLNLHPMEDLAGDYIPKGYVQHLPASAQPESYFLGPEYSSFSAVADLEQTNFGAYALLHAGLGVELGTGLFYRRKLASVTTFQYRDAYVFNSTDGTTDEYLYEDSWPEGRSDFRIIDRSLAVPLVIQWRYFWPLINCGTNFTYWMGGKDPYFSFKTFVGLNF